MFHWLLRLTFHKFYAGAIEWSKTTLFLSPVLFMLHLLTPTFVTNETDAQHCKNF